MVNWGNALLVVVLGLGIVFIVLAIIMFVLIVMEKMLAPKEKNTPPVKEEAEKAHTAPQKTEEVKKDDSEVVAAICAAICTVLNTSPGGFKIKSYRKLGESKSAWNRASRNENIYNGF